MPITVAIVDDEDPVRESLAALIGGMPGFRCVGSYRTAEEALKYIPCEKPNVVLMDIHLPKMNGIECLGRLKPKIPATQVLMLTGFEETENVFLALREGAAGYLVKRTPPNKLLEAIEEAHHGGSPMSPNIARKVVQYFHRAGPAKRETENLSKREQEILDHLCKGYLYKEIADALSIGTETVRSHLRRIYEKLHVRSRTEAVVKHLRKQD